MLKQILKQKPSHTLAFLPTAEADVLAETMVAFANTDGGIIVVGVDLQGQPTGQLLPDEVETALMRAIPQCRPPVVAEWDYHELPGGSIVTLRVHRSPELHALLDGRVLLRQRTENRPLSGEAIRQLAATKSSADFETEVIPQTSLLDLDQHLLQEYLALREKQGRRSVSLDDHLLEMGAMTEDGEVTVTGLLLFGKRPQGRLPQSGVIFVRFHSQEPRGRDGLPGYGRRVKVEGPLPRVIEQCWQLMGEEMRSESVVRGLKREERTEYPQFSVREALINALCHRDYRLRGRRVEVRMYEDRLEVISPGGLPGYMTLDNLVDEHFSRNPRLVAGLFEWGYIEELGLGIDRMIEEMLQAGHPTPEFKATPYSFTVKLFNAQERVPVRQWDKWDRNMNERQIKAMTLLETHGRITSRDYQTLCPDVSPETLRLDLVDLVDKGLLLKIGDKKGTYYILK
jgi:ATP-dependent DNA helicase RecG